MSEGGLVSPTIASVALDCRRFETSGVSKKWVASVF